MLQYFIVASLGALLGWAELVSRYRDTPAALLTLPVAYLYILFNVVMSCAALYILGVFPIDIEGAVVALDATAKAIEDARIAAANKQYVYEIVIAGLGAAAFFRSSIARTKVGETEISVGPSFIIDAFLGATDREIDRRRALARTDRIPDLMRNIPAGFAAEALTQYCIGALQNLPAADEKTLETRAASVLSGDLPSEIKSMLVGLILSEYVGHAVLEHAIKKLETEIKAKNAGMKRLEETLNVDDLTSKIENPGTE